MTTVEMIRTYDGQVFGDEGLARRHLEKQLGELITTLAHRLTRAEKYTKIVAILESETETFRKIVQIQDDMQLTSDN